MSILKTIFSGGLSQILDSTGGIIDKFKLSPKEKESFKLQMETLLQEEGKLLEETYQQEVDAKKQIMIAELTQSDKFTKRARPSIVYMGLLFIFIIHVLLPFINFFIEKSIPNTIKLPPEFWMAWGGVVGVYGIGRTFEKTGIRNKVTNAITGSGAFRIGANEPKG